MWPLATFPDRIVTSCSIAICRIRARPRSAPRPVSTFFRYFANAPSDRASWARPLVSFHATTLHDPLLRLQGEGFPPSPRETLRAAIHKYYDVFYLPFRDCLG